MSDIDTKKEQAAEVEAPEPAAEPVPEADDSVVRTYLQGETAANQQSFKFGLIIFGILILFVIVLFSWYRSMLKEFTEPKTLARTLVGTIEIELPNATQAFEESVEKVLPKVVTFVMDSVVSKGVPQMRKHAEGYLNDHATAMAEFASTTGTDMFRVLLRENRQSMKVASYPEATPEPDVLVASLESTVKLGLPGKLDLHLQESENTVDAESAAYKLHKTRRALLNINAKLNELADADSSTRSQGMQKRIIGAWWSWLRGSGGRAAAEGAEGTTLFDGGQSETDK
jgi:hypothetical protein